ncbi:hypothetical protein F5Y11DRAFT_323583 [Daldinia sp. FL1419]|nr:hypothetical protein F5Y11DRAFT_323583 [Daldinia sp. FL1419]
MIRRWTCRDRVARGARRRSAYALRQPPVARSSEVYDQRLESTETIGRAWIASTLIRITSAQCTLYITLMPLSRRMPVEACPGMHSNPRVGSAYWLPDLISSVDRLEPLAISILHTRQTRTMDDILSPSTEMVPSFGNLPYTADQSRLTIRISGDETSARWLQQDHASIFHISTN